MSELIKKSDFEKYNNWYVKEDKYLPIIFHNFEQKKDYVFTEDERNSHIEVNDYDDYTFIYKWSCAKFKIDYFGIKSDEFDEHDLVAVDGLNEMEMDYLLKWNCDTYKKGSKISQQRLFIQGEKV
mgnify:CR=1 FL=1